MSKYEPRFGDGQEEDHLNWVQDHDYCRHPFERLLRIRGSLMCGVCHKEVDSYGSPLDKALLWWEQSNG